MCGFDSQQPLFDTLVVVLLSNEETRKGAYLRGHDASACSNGFGSLYTIYQSSPFTGKRGFRRSLKCSRFRRLGAQSCYFKKQTETFACVCACSRVANLLEFVFVKGIELRSFVSKSSNVQRDTRFNLCPSLRAAPGCVPASVGTHAPGTHARMHAAECGWTRWRTSKHKRGGDGKNTKHRRRPSSVLGEHTANRRRGGPLHAGREGELAIGKTQVQTRHSSTAPRYCFIPGSLRICEALTC